MLQEFENLTRRVTALENQLNQLVRIGIVVQVLPDLGKVRCRLHDADCMETFELAVLFPKTRLDKYYAMPDIGEQVLCLFLPLNNGLSLGFVLGAFYSLIDRPPVADSGKTVINFEDGSRLIYDKEYGDLAMHIKGSVTIAANGPLKLAVPQVLGPMPSPFTGEPELNPIEAPEPEECDG